MAKKTKEEKLAEMVEDYLSDHYFSTSLFADIVTTDIGTYTLDRLMELVSHIIKHAEVRFKYEWEAGNTSEGLLLADALNDTLKQLDK